MKKLISLVLVIIIVFSTTSIAFANQSVVQIEEQQVSIMMISENRMLITEAETVSMISVEETSSELVVTNKNLTTGEEHYFIRDYDNNTLYSSITGYTGTVQMVTDPAVGWYYVTYESMMPYFDEAITAADIASYVTSMCGCRVLPTVFDAINLLLQVIKLGLQSGVAGAGIKYLINYSTITEVHGGESYELTVKCVTDFGTFG